MMFAAPPEQSFEWAENGVESAHKWLRTRLWPAVHEVASMSGRKAIDVNTLSDAERELRRQTHELLAKAYDDYGRRLAFNTVVAASMSLMNAVNKHDAASDQAPGVLHEALSAIVMAMAPITPHISESLWRTLHESELAEARWMTADESAMVRSTVPLVIQINGKLRANMDVAADISEEDATQAAREHPNCQKYFEGKTVRKVIFVPGKLINFVVN